MWKVKNFIYLQFASYPNDYYDDKNFYDDLDYNYNRSYSSINEEDDLINKPSSKKSKSLFKKPIMLISMCLLSVIGLGLISYGIYTTIQTINKGSAYTTNQSVSGQYNTASDATYWLSERTVSLQFKFLTTESNKSFSPWIESGTGWVYSADKSTDTFYIATNFHVANILSLAGKTITNKDGITTTYSSDIVSSIGLVGDVTENNNVTSTNKMLYFNVGLPSIVYTTLSDSSFNSVLNKNNQKLYDGIYANKTTKFKGVSDFALLKYTFNPNSIKSSDINPVNWNISTDSAISYFKNWISVYFANPTVVYDKPMEDLNLSTLKLSMAGFPLFDARTNSTNSDNKNITWLPFSNFSTFGSALSPASSSTMGNPLITFYPSDLISSNDVADYNFQSIGLLSLIQANSYGGASGSPIVANFGTDKSPNFQIVGIYWGQSSLNLSGYTLTYGAMTWFATSNYKLSNSNSVSYNMTNHINSIVNKS